MIFTTENILCTIWFLAVLAVAGRCSWELHEAVNAYQVQHTTGETL